MPVTVEFAANEHAKAVLVDRIDPHKSCTLVGRLRDPKPVGWGDPALWETGSADLLSTARVYRSKDLQNPKPLGTRYNLI